MKFNRRKFLQDQLQYSLALALLMSSRKVAMAQQLDYENQKDVYIRSDLGQSFVLSAKQRQAGLPIENTFFIQENTHKHDIRISQEDLHKLNAGETLRFQSNISEGHSHTITIDPKDHVTITENANTEKKDKKLGFPYSIVLSDNNSGPLYIVAAADAGLQKVHFRFGVGEFVTLDSTVISGRMIFTSPPLPLEKGDNMLSLNLTNRSGLTEIRIIKISSLGVL